MSGRRKIFAAVITTLALVALVVSAYLTWVTWQSSAVAGCTAGSAFDCDEVLGSRWSKWYGMPVSLLGAGCYLAILSLCWPAASRPHGYATTALFSLAVLAAGAATWFLGLQLFEIQSFCFYCLTVHSCGFAIGVLAFLLFVDADEAEEYDQMRSLLGVAADKPAAESAAAPSATIGMRLLAALSFAAVGLATLLGGQLLSDWSGIEEIVVASDEPEPTSASSADADALTAEEIMTGGDGKFAIVDDPAESEAADPSGIDQVDQSPTTSSVRGGTRRVRFNALPESINVNSFPMLGDPQAEHVMLEMMDYTCKHCRKLHVHLKASLDHYGDQLSIVVHHTPISKKCNPNVRQDPPGKSNACDYAKLAISVWKLAPEKFPEYHDWLLESDDPPGIVTARKRAMKLAGLGVLGDKVLQAELGKRLAQQNNRLRDLKTGLPALLLSNGAIRGVPDKSQALYDYIEKKLKIEPVGLP